jgi:hypothetical protein
MSVNDISQSRARLLDAIFTADTLPRLLLHWAEKPGRAFWRC